MPAFIITAYQEPLAQITTAIESIRRVYPEACIDLIYDGPYGPRDDAYEGVDIVHGAHLKTPATGKLWWDRFFATAESQDVVFKFDPDAVLRREFRLPFPEGVFGRLLQRGTIHEHIQGGVQGFSRKARERLRGNLDLLDQSPLPQSRGDYFSSDHSIAWLAKMIDVDLIHYPEIFSVACSRHLPPQIGDVAAIHPVKP